MCSGGDWLLVVLLPVALSPWGTSPIPGLYVEVSRLLVSLDVFYVIFSRSGRIAGSSSSLRLLVSDALDSLIVTGSVHSSVFGLPTATSHAHSMINSATCFAGSRGVPPEATLSAGSVASPWWGLGWAVSCVF